MRLVLDSNEFIFAIGLAPNISSRELIETIIDKQPKISLHIPRLVINEVRDNVHPRLFSEFLKFIKPFALIDEDNVVPFEIGVKFEKRGLKPDDAFIAGYKVLSAEKCLKLL